VLTSSVYRWSDHTSELELQIEAASEEDVFADALLAFAELAGRRAGDERRTIELEADDRGLMLVDWLNELVYLADSNGFVPASLDELRLADGRLTATVSGSTGRPRPLVKAVSLHGLRYAREADGWQARVVLDV
jgi:SHS2 domain-containing protein